MKSFSIAFAATAAISALSTVTAAGVDSIVVKGSKFFYATNGTQFYIKGVAYQADVTNQTGTAKFTDPLTDSKACARDIPLMQALGLNTIRVYAIDTTGDHSGCMNMLNAAGMYVVADLSEPGTSIDRDAPIWDLTLYNRYTSVIDLLAPYSNVLGFFAGNEVTNNNTNTDASPFVKAAVRDMKKYIAAKKYRTIPVGYATNDASTIRDDLADYFNCGPASDAIDFWGYNIYSWCDPSDYVTSGWNVRTQDYSNYSVPVFFAEYGCNNMRPKARTFEEVESLYGTNMTGVFSGGIVYMYFQETNDFGLVQITGGADGTASILTDYTNLKNELAKVDPTGVNMASYTPTNTAARSCPATGADWSASTVLPPTPDNDLCTCMSSSLSCVAASTVNDTQYDSLFSYICSNIGADGCDGISKNGTTGQYGAFSNCLPLQRLSWAMNAYYGANKATQNSDACKFGGSGQVQTSSTNSTCSAKLGQVGGVAGTATASPSSAATTSHKAAGYALSAPTVSLSAINVCIALFSAFFGGVGLVLL